MPDDLREVPVSLGARSHPVLIGSGVLAGLGRRLEGLGRVSRYLVVTNPTVAPLYRDRLLEGLASGPAPAAATEVVEMPDGEEHKTLATVSAIYAAALGLGVDRDAVVVALGGGVVGDVAGFAAATILRGVRLVMVPTTLLSQVDSSVGGKTGVNTREGKNLVGAFHQPSFVGIDPTTLGTLPEREYRAGLGEVVKYGMILDRALFELLEECSAEVVARDAGALTDIIARCVALKAEVVEKDEREGGLRRILNFGHTAGHAVEKATKYRRYLHGEAVAIGMVVAARLSARLGRSDARVEERLVRLLGTFGLPVAVPADLAPEALLEAIGHDKKVRGESVAFIVSEGIGRCRAHALSPAEILSGIEEVTEEAPKAPPDEGPAPSGEQR